MHEFVLLEILAVGLTLALVFGFLTTKLHLSPIVGYLLAGFLIGPNSPGFVADTALAYELSEVGVILLMFGVGLHFDLKDLLAVKGVAIPGAIMQTSAATVFGVFAGLAFGLSISSGLILGLSLAVASTVVLMRMLEDQGTLDTVHGHVAVGWLVVEDIITVLLLVLLPTLAGILGTSQVDLSTPQSMVKSAAYAIDALTQPTAASADYLGQAWDIALAVGMALMRLAALWILVLPVGGRIIPWFMAQVAKTRSNELFTLAVLVLAFAIAVGAAAFFDTSVALGAFLAGMVVGKTKSSHRAASDLLPLRDTFAVLFFLSVGMLFNPVFIIENPGLIIACMLIVLVIKPLTAIMTVVGLGYSAQTALTVGVGLAQVGEFSFILATQARSYHLITSEVYNVLVVCALISITLNPILFGTIPKVENYLRRHEGLWNFLNRKAIKAANEAKEYCEECLLKETEAPKAIVVGYGPTGKKVAQALKNNGAVPVVIDLNMDAVNELSREGELSIYGDSSQRSILMAAGIEQARYMMLTIPNLAAVGATSAMAISINPDIKIIARARFLHDVDFLHSVGVHVVAVEEEQVAFNMVNIVLSEMNHRYLSPEEGGAPATLEQELTPCI